MNDEHRASGVLGIHVLGPGYGESIVLDLPDGTVGVIDLFRGPRGSVPTIDFLAQRPAPVRVRFLAVTHPHADHCQGLPDFVNQFEPEEFFVFDTFQDQQLFQFFQALLKHGRRDAVEEAMALNPGTVGHQLASFDRYLKKNVIKQTPSRVKLLRFPQVRKIFGRKVVLRFLTPGDVGSSRYREALHGSLKTLIGDGPSLDDNWNPTPINHNLISGSILVEYGSTRLLLMSDGEIPLWNDLLETLSENQESLPAPVQLVKIAHHGSVNGYVSAFYDSMCRSGHTLAVVTPFARQGTPLPRGEGLRALRSHVASIFSTNRSAAAHSSGLRWELVGSLPLQTYPDGIPSSWVSLLLEKPRLIKYLAPELGGLPSLPPDTTFPLEFVPECLQNPKLLGLLHPDLKDIRIVEHRPSVFDEFRVSFYFDENGQENRSRRYIGWGAGMLSDHR